MIYIVESFTLALSKIDELINLVESTESDQNDGEDIASLIDLCKSLKSKMEKDNNILQEQNFSNNFNGLLSSFYDGISNALSTFSKDELISSIQSVKNIIGNIARIKMLYKLSSDKSNVVIIGANGSGKSTFINKLNGSGLNNLTVIPAQKLLIFDENAYGRERITLSEYRKIAGSNAIDNYRGVRNEFDFNQNKSVVDPFTYLITLIVNDYSISAVTDRRNGLKNVSDTILDRLEVIWKKLIPRISFDIDPIKREFIVKKDNDKYSVAQMSDGEKCILFYIGNILYAEKDGYIAVDEPETFLNPSVYNKLWDLLISERSDCQFIFTSHNMEFINARYNTSLFWCKNYMPPDHFELVSIDSNNDFPTELLTGLVGSRKPILFCEGSQSSYDYAIYSSLFMDEYTVKPVGGHTQVIEYTKMFNDLSSLDIDAFGIIDNDGLDKGAVDNLIKDSVYVLPYNEIEMLLMNRKVIKSVLELENADSTVISNLMNNYEERFFDKMKNSLDKVILNIIKNRLDIKIQKSFIDSSRISNTVELNQELEKLFESFEIEKKSMELKKYILKLIDVKDYDQLLKLCPLKKEITDGLGNRHLCPRYGKFAKGRIRVKKDLQDLLISQIIGIKSES